MKPSFFYQPDRSGSTTFLGRRPAPHGHFLAGLLFLLAALATGLTPAIAQNPNNNNILYVNQNVPGGDGSGSSWANAIPELADALQWAREQHDNNTASWDENNPLQIWVATGTYKPLYNAADGQYTTDGDRDNAFVLVPNVQLYGGFAGNETNITARDWVNNPTTLSGDLGTPDDNSDNAYHVLISANEVGNALLDGFTITAGNADGSGTIPVNGQNIWRNEGGGMSNSGSSSPTLTNVTFSGNSAPIRGGGMNNFGNPVLTNVTFSGNSAGRGGGMANHLGSSPTLTNVTFSGNSATILGSLGSLGNDGGGMVNQNSSPVLTNVTFSGNTSGNNGGGMYNWGSSSPTLTNVTFSGNTSGNDGGGMYNWDSSPTLTNVIIWGNQAGGDDASASASIFNDNSTPSISYSLIANSGGSGEDWDEDLGDDNENNMDVDPEFIESANPEHEDFLRLANTSPAINMGDPGTDLSIFPGGPGSPTDLAGNPRVYDLAGGGVIDIGAYEFQGDPFGTITPGDGNIVYVDQTVNTEAEGYNASGDSWVNALPELRDALSWAETDWDATTNGILQIWVAGGVYTPTDDSDNRTATFQLLNNVEVYGGFAGSENNLEGRNWEAHPTILSGDIDGDDNAEIITDPENEINGNNSYHVVTGSGTNATARLDGFTITAGLANGGTTNDWRGGGMVNDGGSPTLTNVTFSGNSAGGSGGGGGGMYNHSNSSPVLTNVAFSGNSATSGGGMVNHTNSSPTLTNVTFSGNSAGNSGGGMFNANSSPTLTNVTFSGNSATSGDGGGMLNNNSSPTLTNVILWGNQAGGDDASASASIFNNNSTPAISYSLIANSGGSGNWDTDLGDDGGNNMDVDPQFIEPADPKHEDFLRLANTSPAINAGNPGTDLSIFPGGPSDPLDLAGNPRVYDLAGGGVIDIGAYEFQGEPLQAPDPIVLTAPGDEALNTSLRPEFEWQEDGSADSYTLLVSLNDDLSDPLIEQSGLTETSVTPDEDLARAATYYWGVFATNPAGDGELSEVFSFTTIPEIPDAVTLLNPADEAVNIILQPTLAWEALAGAEHCQLMVSANSDFSDPVVDENDLSETDYTIGDDLSRDQTYFWRVRSTNPGGTGQWSEVYSFTTIPESSEIVILLSPADEAQNVVLQPLFEWNAADGAETYDLVVSENDDFTDPVISEDELAETSFHASDDLEVSAIYYWRVRGVNPAGPGGWSEPFRFTTRELPEGGDRRVLAGNRQAYTFSGADVGLTEESYSIRIASVTGGGTLSAAADDELTIAQINGGALTYEPEPGNHGYGFAAFTFTIIDDTALESEAAYTMAIDVAAASLELTGGKGWRFLTSPSQGDTFGEFLSPLHVQGVEGSANPGSVHPNLFLLNQEQYQWETPGAMSNVIARGQAFIVYIYGDDDNDGFPKTLISGENWEPLENEFSFGSLGFDPGQGPGGNSHFLIANPHPIAIDFCEMYNTSANVANSIDVWDPGANGGNGDYVNLSCSIGDVFIAPFQGFWVLTTNTNPVLEIPQAAYLESTEEGYFKQPNNERSAMSGKDIADLGQNQEDLTGLANLSGLALTVQSADGIFTNTARILFSEDGTTGLDAFDALKLSPAGLAERWLSFHSLDEDNRGYALQSLPSEALAEDGKISIPLDIQTTEAGKFTLNWLLPESSEFAGSYYLKDNRTGEVMELREGAGYRFEIEPGQASSSVHFGWTDDSPPGALNSGSRVVHSFLRGEWADEAPRFELILSRQALDEHGELPSSVALEQNYPNPFNPSTIISYELPQAGQVRLDVYDMTGRQVATLVDTQMSAGRHQVSFDASGLSSGVYIYRLQAGGQLLTRQLTLIK